MITTIPIRRRLWLAGAAVCLACGSDRVIEPPPPPGSFPQIEVRYSSSDVPTVVRIAVADAVDKWTRALSKDMGEFHLTESAGECFVGEPQIDERHHNLLLFVSVLQVDGRGGNLAYTEVCGLSSRDTLPVLSHIRIDRADLD